MKHINDDIDRITLDTLDHWEKPKYVYYLEDELNEPLLLLTGNPKTETLVNIRNIIHNIIHWRVSKYSQDLLFDCDERALLEQSIKNIEAAIEQTGKGIFNENERKAARDNIIQFLNKYETRATKLRDEWRVRKNEYNMQKEISHKKNEIGCSVIVIVVVAVVWTLWLYSNFV